MAGISEKTDRRRHLRHRYPRRRPPRVSHGAAGASLAQGPHTSTRRPTPRLSYVPVNYIFLMTPS
ncbi:hypothetical protein E2C01_046115 [Portunus trituberculatus]|uniref:Uncharacterized protein n=1 Tax=Portunus trituberculatus TaxID=210409 RepID=A0A5B7G037_PORTR|nr:hypothetical protein [Portunus trituberculatus]